MLVHDLSEMPVCGLHLHTISLAGVERLLPIDIESSCVWEAEAKIYQISLSDWCCALSGTSLPINEQGEVMAQRQAAAPAAASRGVSQQQADSLPSRQSWLMGF